MISKLLLLLFIAVPLASAAETFDPKKSCTASFWDEESEPAASAPPEVLHTQMDYSAIVRGERYEDGTHAVHEVAATATLAVSDQKTSGFFDYVKSMKISSDLEDRPDSEAVYTWDRDRYQPVGDVEPLESNCLIAGFDLADGAQHERFPEWVTY
jgi:hypothetical protein